jgi:hypothetical protein
LEVLAQAVIEESECTPVAASISSVAGVLRGSAFVTDGSPTVLP